MRRLFAAAVVSVAFASVAGCRSEQVAPPPLTTSQAPATSSSTDDDRNKSTPVTPAEGALRVLRYQLLPERPAALITGVLRLVDGQCLRIFPPGGGADYQDFALVFPKETTITPKNLSAADISISGQTVSTTQEVTFGGGEMSVLDERLEGPAAVACNAPPRWQVTDIIRKPPGSPGP